MSKVIDGGLYALGVLIVCTVWSVVSYVIIEQSIVEKVAVEQVEPDPFGIPMPVGPNG